MPKPASLLALITADEAHDFLAGPMWNELQEVGTIFRHCDPSTLNAAEVQRTLADFNPEVLVAAWKTPLLPAVLPDKLRYVCHLCGTIKRLVTRRHLEQGLLVSNWGGSISRIVAEWALFHTLSCLRRATTWALAMHLEGGWKDRNTETASLFGRTIGIHGFGMVARELVLLLRPFDVRVRVFAPDVDAEAERVWGVQHCASLDALFAENDIVIELAPLIPETKGIVTEHLLRLIRSGGVFVNVGRGAVVDETALLRIAREGRIQVGLDVFAHEPLPIDSEFRGLRNVTLTPHLAGPTTDRRCDAGRFALRNLHAYSTGQPLEAVITPEVFDQSS
jgi:phosphoglycerate dehydrogenase-like enzyme